VPVERISKGFKDISASFQINPLNEDLIALKNETAIARSIRNLVLTIKGESPFAPNLGCGVNALLFENMDQITASVVRDEIINVIDSFEPRVDLIDVIVVSNFDTNSLEITVQYYVVGAEIPAQELTFALQPTR
jgi:phage baseplate assembly protein W